MAAQQQTPLLGGAYAWSMLDLRPTLLIPLYRDAQASGAHESMSSRFAFHRLNELQRACCKEHYGGDERRWPVLNLVPEQPPKEETDFRRVDGQFLAFQIGNGKVLPAVFAHIEVKRHEGQQKHSRKLLEQLQDACSRFAKDKDWGLFAIGFWSTAMRMWYWDKKAEVLKDLTGQPDPNTHPPDLWVDAAEKGARALHFLGAFSQIIANSNGKVLTEGQLPRFHPDRMIWNHAVGLTTLWGSGDVEKIPIPRHEAISETGTVTIRGKEWRIPLLAITHAAVNPTYFQQVRDSFAMTHPDLERKLHKAYKHMRKDDFKSGMQIVCEVYEQLLREKRTRVLAQSNIASRYTTAEQQNTNRVPSTPAAGSSGTTRARLAATQTRMTTSSSTAAQYSATRIIRTPGQYTSHRSGTRGAPLTRGAHAAGGAEQGGRGDDESPQKRTAEEDIGDERYE